MTRHKALDPRDEVYRLCVSRKEGGRRLTTFKYNVNASLKQLQDYTEKYEGGLITAITNDTDNMKTNRMTITRKQKWEEKQLYGRFKQLISNISNVKTWTRLRKGNLKREIEYILIAAQNNAI